MAACCVPPALTLSHASQKRYVHPALRPSQLCTYIREKNRRNHLGFFRWRNQHTIVCKESVQSLQESGNKKRAARKAMTVIQRVELAKEEMERRAIKRNATRLFPRALLDTLMDRIRLEQWEGALKVFGLVRHQEWYDGDIGTYIKLIEMLGKCKKPDHAAALFDLMFEDGCQPTVQAFTALLTVYSRNNLLDRAFTLFEAMQDFQNCEPDVYTYSLMIKSCCDAGLHDKAHRLLHEMRETGVEPNTVTFNTLISAFGRERMFPQMEELFKYMLGMGSCQPDMWTWNAVIHSYGANGQIGTMETWFGRLQKSDFLPDMVTLNSLVKAYGKKGLYGKMHCVIEYMYRYNYDVNAATYNIVIHSYGTAGLIEQMESTFTRMKCNGVKPNKSTFSSLLNAYGKQGLSYKVEKIMRQVRNSDVVPDAAIYNAAIDAYQRTKSLEDMERMFEEMKSVRCMPDTVTYCIMIEAFKRYRRLDKATQMELELQELRQ